MEQDAQYVNVGLALDTSVEDSVADEAEEDIEAVVDTRLQSLYLAAGVGFPATLP